MTELTITEEDYASLAGKIVVVTGESTSRQKPHLGDEFMCCRGFFRHRASCNQTPRRRGFRRDG